MSLAVLGAGAFGTALACVWAQGGEAVTLVAREGAEAMDAARENARRLPGITLPESVRVTDDMEAARSADTLALAVPAQAVRGTLRAVEPRGDVVICAKGIERETGALLTALAPTAFILSGPGFAGEIAQGRPTAMTLAHRDEASALALARTLSRPAFRLYACGDPDGVAAGGALKNVAALAVGIAHGLELGESAKAALVTRAHGEIVRLGMMLGGTRETFFGLSGMGDLVLTCGPGSRNFRYGVALARGDDLAGHPLAEGVASAQVASRLAAERGIEAPVIEAVAAILAGNLAPPDAIRRLMLRPIRAEGE